MYYFQKMHYLKLLYKFQENNLVLYMIHLCKEVFRVEPKYRNNGPGACLNKADETIKE